MGESEWMGERRRGAMRSWERGAEVEVGEAMVEEGFWFDGGGDAIDGITISDDDATTKKTADMRCEGTRRRGESKSCSATILYRCN